VQATKHTRHDALLVTGFDAESVAVCETDAMPNNAQYP